MGRETKAKVSNERGIEYAQGFLEARRDHRGDSHAINGFDGRRGGVVLEQKKEAVSCTVHHPSLETKALSTFHAAGVLLFCVAFGPSVGVGVVGVGEVGTGVAGAVGELGTAGVGAAGLGGWALAFSFARTSMNT